MDTKLIQLKGDFNNIISIRTTVKNIFDILQVRIDKLKDLYAEFIKTSKTQMFIFGLDSFNFQSKLIDIEYDDMKRLFLAINNRMYCEYFKLYKIIIEYILNSNYEKKVTDLVKFNNYPIYKDLEPFKEYKFEIVSDIHEDIINLLSLLLSTITNKENELLIHKGKQRIGLNIDNFITTFNYNITTIKEKLTLFVTYIDFFHKLHTTYLKRFANKIQLMYTHVNNDIHFDESVALGKQNSDSPENTISESSTNSKRNIYSRSSTDSRKSTNNKASINIKLQNSPNQIFDSNENSLDIEINDNIFTQNSRSRTNSPVSSNTSSNSTITPRFTFKDTINQLTNINTKEESKKIETTLSYEDLNNMFSSIDMTCDFLIKKNNETPPVTPQVTSVIDNDTEIIVEEHIIKPDEEEDIGPLVNPVVSSFFERNDKLLEPKNYHDNTIVNETIIKNISDNFLLMVDTKEDNNTDNDTDNDNKNIITVTSELMNDNENNTKITKKKRNKAKKNK
uniref:Uncharacterized protein n=1 Tax=viral metagenome TaxID=1070528 RepID=A0A6C0ARQ8_9ZZZZ